MDARRERELVYARAMRVRGGPALRDAGPPPEIVESWRRCIDAGLDFAVVPRMSVVADAQLQRRREQAHVVRSLALAELETLFAQIAGSNFLLAFADRDGVVLDLYADNRFASSGSGEEIVVGSHWNEQVAGTNGLGTALASGKPVAVNGPEHFFTRFGDISCTASPIRDASGTIVGVLDASSYVESRQRHTQALVQMAASHIEHLLFTHERDSDVLLAIHPRTEFLATLSAGLLAFDAHGRLSAFNARAEALLAGLDMPVGTSFESLFGEPFGRVLTRLHNQPAVPLRDVLGSTLVASWINRRVRARRQRPLPSASWPHAVPHIAPQPEDEPVADDIAVRRAVDTIVAAVRRDAPVLLRGETGSGKEVLARLSHRLGGRDGPFVALHCGELPHERCEAALFGYVGGAFEGADPAGHAGLIASADGGTLLLDEVSRLAPGVQAALLRFLDDRMVRPLGSPSSRRVNVQLLASTNAQLDHEVAAGHLRADLLFRLNTVVVDLPPLRERSDFASCVLATLRRIDPHASISDSAIAHLAAYAWPGNFRELRAVLTRALLLHPTRHLDLPDMQAVLHIGASGPPASSDLRHLTSHTVLQEFRRTGNVTQTARNLGISRTTVYRHLRETGTG